MGFKNEHASHTQVCAAVGSALTAEQAGTREGTQGAPSCTQNADHTDNSCRL